MAAQVTVVMVAVTLLMVLHLTLGTADTRHHKINHNTAVAWNTDTPVLRKLDNQDILVELEGPVMLTKKENPALRVLPKENGLLDHYGRKEANCVQDAPKAG